MQIKKPCEGEAIARFEIDRTMIGLKGLFEIVFCSFYKLLCP